MRATILCLALLIGATPAGAAPAAHGQTVAAQSPAMKAFSAKVEATKQAMMGDPAIARKSAEDLLRMADAMKRDGSVSARDAAISSATARWLLAEAYIGLNDAPRAKSLVAEALTSIQSGAPGSKLNGDLLRSRATLSEMGGDVQGALKDYLSAHRIFRAIGEARSRAIALQDIGNLYLEAADFDRVQSYYSQSLEAYSEDPWLNLATYNNRGQAYREQGNFAKAEAEYGLALKAARQLESQLLEARILTNLAETQYELGKLDQALATLARAESLVAQGGEAAGWHPFILGVRAMVEARRGDTAKAGQLMSAAFAGQDLAKTEMPFRELHEAATGIYEALGERDAALAHLKAFQRLDREALRLTASVSAQLMSAQFDFANQNLKISELKQGQLQRDITIERQRGEFRTRLFIGLGTALLIIFAMLAFGYVSIRRSRNQVRATNVELSASNVALEKALKARTDFLATTSHEIRTPLNGVLGMAQVLLADRRISKDTRERVELLRGAGETMKTLVDDILDVAKMEAGDMPVENEEVDLARLIADCVGLWREAAAGKSLALECALNNVPARVMTDGGRLRQILSNLLSNAVKFTPQGSVTLSVSGTADGVAFVVRDTGIGIDEAEHARIFEAFTQANNSTTREFSGTGLGLAISQRLAKALGGDIAVTSAPGEGSCFTLTLPLQAVGEGYAEIAEVSDTLAHAAVLMIERNIASHALMRMLLAPETRTVDIAFSAEDALEQMKSAHFDHILIEGASTGGIDDIRAIVAAAGTAGSKTTLLAAPTDQLGKADIFAAGADQVILKPVGAADLIAGLKALYGARVDQGEDNPPMRIAS